MMFEISFKTIIIIIILEHEKHMRDLSKKLY